MESTTDRELDLANLRILTLEATLSEARKALERAKSDLRSIENRGDDRSNEDETTGLIAASIELIDAHLTPELPPNLQRNGDQE